MPPGGALATSGLINAILLDALCGYLSSVRPSSGARRGALAAILLLFLCQRFGTAAEEGGDGNATWVRVSRSSAAPRSRRSSTTATHGRAAARCA